MARPLREVRVDNPDRLALCVNVPVVFPSLACSRSVSPFPLPPPLPPPFPPPLLPSPRTAVVSLADRVCRSGRRVADAICLGPDGLVVVWPVVLPPTAPLLDVDCVCPWAARSAWLTLRERRLLLLPFSTRRPRCCCLGLKYGADMLEPLLICGVSGPASARG